MWRSQPYVKYSEYSKNIIEDVQHQKMLSMIFVMLSMSAASGRRTKMYRLNTRKIQEAHGYLLCLRMSLHCTSLGACPEEVTFPSCPVLFSTSLTPVTFKHMTNMKAAQTSVALYSVRLTDSWSSYRALFAIENIRWVYSFQNVINSTQCFLL